METLLPTTNGGKTTPRSTSPGKQFRHGYPPYLDDMDRMFEHASVDGSSACCAATRTAQQVEQVESSDEYEDDDEDDTNTEAEQTGTPPQHDHPSLQ